MKQVLIAVLTVWLFVSLVNPAANAQGTEPKPSDKVVFDTTRLQVGSKIVKVELADTDPKRERGLMFRKSLADNTGMLFIFEQERPLAFWMKNTLIPLSIGYYSSERKLLETHEMVPAVMGAQQPPTYPSVLPAKYALEMPKGWFRRNQIKPGTMFSYVTTTEPTPKKSASKK